MSREVAPPHHRSPSARSALIGAIRMGLGVVAAVGAVLGMVAAGFAAVLWPAFGGGDDYERTLLGLGLVVAGLCLVSVFLFSSSSFRDLVYSRVFWAATLVCGLALVWGAFGIDSTRPLREMPEASMEVPGARETAVRTFAARSGIEGGSPAELRRAFESDGPSAHLEEFFVRTLPPRGWTYSHEWHTTDGDRYLEWERGGYLFQLRLSDPNDPWPGAFLYSIFGPRD